ncbi:MAG: hypothetical protein R3258_05515 [Acidimicrobiia bacterium]|nr:hypothetical protein [Acidimicrobiia bacterium]
MGAPSDMLPQIVVTRRLYQPIRVFAAPAAIRAARLAAAARIRTKRAFILARSPSMPYLTGLACRSVTFRSAWVDGRSFAVADADAEYTNVPDLGNP